VGRTRVAESARARGARVEAAQDFWDRRVGNLDRSFKAVARVRIPLGAPGGCWPPCLSCGFGAISRHGFVSDGPPDPISRHLRAQDHRDEPAASKSSRQRRTSRSLNVGTRAGWCALGEGREQTDGHGRVLFAMRTRPA
jgi:hypothetical protein